MVHLSNHAAHVRITTRNLSITTVDNIQTDYSFLLFFMQTINENLNVQLIAIRDSIENQIIHFVIDC